MVTINQAALPPQQDHFPELGEVKLKKGDTIPIRFKAQGDVLNLKSVVQTVEVTRSLFFKLADNGEAYVKLNQQDPWREFSDIFTGQLDTCIIQATETPLRGEVSLNLFVRN